MPVKLLKCSNLHECDKYFSKMLSNGVLGYLEPQDGEIDHLSRLISQALKDYRFRWHGSLSLAIYLVWMGWLYYQEGNYWEPVYQNLGLPLTQTRWQGVLGDSFHESIRKHNLQNFQGKLRYISSILAHGFVPNWYAESYFEDVVLEIYKEREKFKLQVKREEVEHLVYSWCQDHAGYEKHHNKIANIELAEKKLSTVYEAWMHKESLGALRNLKNKLVDKAEMDELLAYPVDRLNQLELKQSEHRKRCDLLQDQFKKMNRIKTSIEAQKSSLGTLENEIEEIAGQVFKSWNENQINLVMDLPVNEISRLTDKIKESRMILSGIKGFLFRIFAPLRYRRYLGRRQQLKENLRFLPVKQNIITKPWLKLPQALFRLQDLLKKREKSILALREINIAYQEAAATTEGSSMADLNEQLSELDKLTQELSSYKKRLVLLGKGSLDKGKEKLDEQRVLLQKIDQLQSRISGDADTLIAVLPLAEKYCDINKLEHRLIKIRKRKKEAVECLKRFKNPLYTLNESTRIFILQGGGKAVQFIYDSLILIDSLQKGAPILGIGIPDRIRQAMQLWWRQKGKGLLEKSWEERAREKSEADGVFIRKPVIKFDPIYKEVKVILPRQPVKKKAMVEFGILDESGQKQVVPLSLLLREGVYWTETVELKVEWPQSLYHLQLKYGDTVRSWKIKGVGADGFCMLFNAKGELVNDNQLPEDSVYLVTPNGSDVDPVEAIKEQMHGHWSGYEYRLIELEDRDVLIVKTSENVSIYRRQVQLQPTLLLGQYLPGITSGDALLFQNELSGLVFSVNHPEEIQFYGLRLDIANETMYKPLEEFNIRVDKDNVVYLSLANITEGRYGSYEVTLEKRGTIIWSKKCVVVPDLDFNFNQAAYRVQDNSKEIGRLEFQSKYGCEFIPKSRANDIRSLSPSVVEFDTRQNTIRGQLIWQLEQKLDIEISVEIPGIRWRQNNSAWKAETEEIWHEKLSDIEVRVPAATGGSITLSLKDNKQVLNSPVHHKKAVFSLHRFSDTVRDCNKPLQEVILSCDNSEISPFILLRVRTRWQVSKINLTQRLHEGQRHLLLEWEDLGLVPDRIARLWPLNLSGLSPIGKAIPNGANTLNIVVPVELIPSGRYRLQLAAIDPWAAANEIIPEKNAENCIDVDIGTEKEYLANYLGKRLKITAFYHGEQGAELESYYWLQVSELNPLFEGEMRLVGNLYSLAPDGTDVEMPYNPVSFYIDGNKMPFLIDREGDGATYCRKCKVMFWEVAHKECGDAVIAPDTIYIKVEDNYES